MDRHDLRRERRMRALAEARGSTDEGEKIAAPLFARTSAASFPWVPQCAGTHWKFTETPWLERRKRVDQMEEMVEGDKRGGPEERAVMEERESVNRRMEEGEQMERWSATHIRAWRMA